MKTDEEISKEVLKKIDRKHKGSIFDKEQQVGMISEHIKEAIALKGEDCEKELQEMNALRLNSYFDGQKAEKENSERRMSEFKERILEMIEKQIKYWDMEWNNGRKHKDEDLKERARVIIQNLKELKKEVLK